MDKEEIKEIIKELKYIERLEENDIANTKHTDSIKKALDKQIPVKPINIYEPVVKWGECPKCHKDKIFSNENYCSNCGQRLDWEE